MLRFPAAQAAPSRAATVPETINRDGHGVGSLSLARGGRQGAGPAREGGRGRAGRGQFQAPRNQKATRRPKKGLMNPAQARQWEGFFFSSSFFFFSFFTLGFLTLSEALLCCCEPAAPGFASFSESLELLLLLLLESEERPWPWPW